jgi:hypothetical protein
VRNRIREIISIKREIIKKIVNNNKAKFKASFNSDLKLNNICKILMLFNILYINLFLLTYNSLILIFVL